MRRNAPNATLFLVMLAAAVLAPLSARGDLRAQQAAPARVAVRLVAGARPDATTYVIVSGLMGGVAGFARLESQLVARGDRVLLVDPYHLSIDSATVSFADLARRVDAVLERHRIDSAVVIAHAHGAGVALRLAAASPRRVSSLYFLDVGALPVSRTKVFSAAFRLAPLIARLPGGRGFLRRRIMEGLRQNAGRDEWIGEAAARTYADPLIDNIGKVVAMAGRLADAREPETVDAVIAKVRAPVTLVLGAVPHPSGPDSVEFTALAPLGARLTIHRLGGVGHFPHEEAPAEVARLITPTRRQQ